MGKTALCLNFAADIAIRQKKTVAIFSLEMSKESLVQRLLSTDSEVNSNRIRTGNLKDADLKRITRSLGRLDEANIYIDDTPSISAMEVRAKARRIKMDKGLDVIIVDYLQLMQGTRSKDGNRNQEISEISRLLKSISRELKVPLIALSQLSRAVEQRTEKKPKLSDLRESGEIEQTADLVIFLHREDYYEMQNVPTSLTELIIAKHRNGPTGVAEVLFLKEFTKFVPKENKLDA
jgi:replicative DNA helicase